MTTFLLVHGGGLRGWHWHLLVAELGRLGHTAITPDVPMNDPLVGASAWADAAINALGSEDDVVVVGHSYAGLCLPVIATRRRVRRLVFLCADVPVPGCSYAEYVATPAGSGATIMPPFELDDQGCILLTFEVARSAYYGDSDEELARTAWEHQTPNATTAFTEASPIEVWPNVPCSYVLCTEDRIRGSEWARAVSVERFGAPAVELPGDHSPMLSRPRELAVVLDELARA